MTRESFIELVYNYGASGDKVFEGLNLKEAQKEDVAIAWGEFDVDDTEEETDEKFGNYYNSFVLDGKWGVNYDPTDLDGYSKGTGGMVCYDEKSLTNTLENALLFDTEKEAQEWVEKNKDEWNYFGEFTIW
jgi:hypothetical protein